VIRRQGIVERWRSFGSMRPGSRQLDLPGQADRADLVGAVREEPVMVKAKNNLFDK
jgi:hypothetical protein